MSSYRGRGNVSIDDISFTNLSIANCARPFEITEESQNNATITNVVVENVRAEMYGFFHLNSVNADTVKNITLRNWEVKMVDGPKPLFLHGKTGRLHLRIAMTECSMGLN